MRPCKRISGRREEAGFGVGEKALPGQEPPEGRSKSKWVDAPKDICTGNPRTTWV